MATTHATAPAANAAAKPDLHSLICYFQGRYVKMGEARLPADDARLPVRHGGLRGHPCLLESG